MAPSFFTRSMFAVTASAAVIRSTSQDDATCSPNGSLLCNGPNQFGLCNWGSVMWQDVSVGMICQDGNIIAASQEQQSIPSSNDSRTSISNYAPVEIECPSRQQWIRPASELSPQESTWVQNRRLKVLDSLSAYLQRLNLESFDVDEYVEKLKSQPINVPTIGMAISGGGYASAYTGTGVLRAFDDRFADAITTRTGGILQIMTYLTGLSGGSIPILSLASHDFPSIQDMVSAWNVNVVLPYNGSSTPTAPNTTLIFQELAPKVEDGYQVSILGYVTRAWGYQFIAGPEGGLNTLFSDVAELPSFQNHSMPLPIWTAAMGQSTDDRYFNIQVPSNSSPAFEFTPFEFGSWPDLPNSPSAFFPTKYMGTPMSSGQPLSHSRCTIGYDRTTYMLAIAASAANFWLIQDFSNFTLAPFPKPKRSSPLHRREYQGPGGLMRELQSGFEAAFSIPPDVSLYTSLPNPFASAPFDTSATAENLTLMDSSEAGQAIPFWPLLRPARRVDFLIGWDNDQDTPLSWNNGTNIYNTYVSATAAKLPFPIVPRPATFINRNYTHTPVFFGCEANLTNTGDFSSPIVLYMANAPYSTYSNFSWTSTAIMDEQLAAVLTNSGNIATQGNNTLDGEWAECLGCAIIDRSLGRVGMGRTEQCERCMARYCWDGVSDDEEPGVVDLGLKLDGGKLTYEEWNEVEEREGGYWKEI